MEENYESSDFLKIEIDSRTTIGIIKETLYYEKEDYDGEVHEIEIPLCNIKELQFNDKTVDVQATKENLIGDFISTIIDSGSHPTRVEYKYSEMIIKYVVEGDRSWKSLKIKNRLLTKEMYNQIHGKVNDGLE